jgi:hypothetical protein
MKKYLFLVLVVVLAGGGYYFYGQKTKEVKAPTEETEKKLANENTTSSEVILPKVENKNLGAETTKPAPTKTTFSDGEGNMAPDISVLEVVYDGNSYIPSSLNIKKGDYVIFKNKSEGKFWPASAPHPSHTDYPAFDPKKAIDAGGKWQFEFTQVGSWKFHDHLNPSAGGVINVSK